MSREPEASPAAPRRSPGLYVGRLLGIGIYLDYSWFAIAALITFTLTTRIFPSALPGHGGHLYVIMAVGTAALFFVSLLLHELGHCAVSQRAGIPVNRITLMFIGGLAEISREPSDPKSELKIALGGPAVTLVLVVIYAGAQWLMARLGFTPASVVFDWLWQMNLALLIFNAIPGYPLDGGRVLRAIIWLRSGNLRHATLISSRCGVAFSWVLMALSLLQLMQGQWSAFVLLLIAFFLRTAAEAGYAQTVQDEVLAGVRVRDVMTKDPVTIPAMLPLNLAVDDYFLAHHHLAYPVCDEDGAPSGLLRLEWLKSVPRERWPYTTVSAVIAETGAPLLTIEAGELVTDAMRRLLEPDQGRLTVVERGRVVGIITRHDVLQFMKIHTELEATPA